MAILQSFFALLSRSAGKILNAVFGWAVRALFGNATAKETTLLSGLVAAAVAWPLLVAGIVFPKIFAFVLGFIPIPAWIPSWTVRVVWAALTLIVPCALGLTIAARAPAHLPRQSFLRRTLSGFPITFGLAVTFLLMFVMVPVLRLAAMARGEHSAQVPLVTTTEAYHQTAALCFRTLNAHGFGLSQTEPAWWARAPLDVLRFFSGNAFAAYVPDRVEQFRADGLELAFYPSGALLRGKGAKLTWAQGLVTETTARTPGLQTQTPEAQQIENELKRLWQVYLDEPEAHARSARLLGRAHDVATRLAHTSIGFDDWQILYRQLLQLERALQGTQQLLEGQLEQSASGAPSVSSAEAKSATGQADEPTHQNERAGRAADARAAHQEVSVEKPKEPNPELRIAVPGAVAQRYEPPPLPSPRPNGATAESPSAANATLRPPADAEPAKPVQDLSTVELVRQITGEVTRLAQKEIELAKTELKANLKAEVGVIGGLSIAAVAALCTVNLLLVTVALALSLVLPAWAAGLIVSGVLLLVTALVAGVAWSKRVRKPLERTRRTLKEDVQWTKERLV